MVDRTETRAGLVILVMGVSGSGKSTVARLLAERLDARFADGDDFHAPESIVRMRGGMPLDDATRLPWLAAVGAWIDARLEAGETGVMACSALRRAYRDGLIRGREKVRLVYLDGAPDVVEARLAARRDHFMPARLLASQFAALEVPAPEERPIVVSILDAPAAIAETIARRLNA